MNGSKADYHSFHLMQMYLLIIRSTNIILGGIFMMVNKCTMSL